MGRVREAKKKKKEDQRRERVRRKRFQVGKKVGKWRNSVLYLSGAGGFLEWTYPQIADLQWKIPINLRLMMTGGSPILGHLHIDHDSGMVHIPHGL